jgi:hypothetical protein
MLGRGNIQLISPLALVAGVFYPVDATRHDYTGLNEAPTWAGFTIAAVDGAALVALATALLHRGWPPQTLTRHAANGRCAHAGPMVGARLGGAVLRRPLYHARCGRFSGHALMAKSA